MRANVRTAVAALLLVLGQLPGQADPTPRRVRTPDGSLFLLVPRPGRPVIWWASFFRMGTAHEPAGLAGLSEACMEASLDGTSRIGSNDPEREVAALDTFDKAVRECDEAVRAGLDQKAILELFTKRDLADATRRKLGDRLAFRRELAAIPTTSPQVETRVDGSLFSCAVPAARLESLATMMELRRRKPMLRGVFDSFAELQARRHAPSDSNPHLREACLLALTLHPVRRTLLPPGLTLPVVTRRQALRFYHQHVRPERGITVLVGGFDPDRVEKTLARVFVHDFVESAPLAPVPREPIQSGQRSIEIAAPGAPRMALAFRIPPGTTLAQREICAALFASGQTSSFYERVVKERGLASLFQVHASFPGVEDPCLFVLDLAGKSNETFPTLVSETNRQIDSLRRDGPTQKQFDRALQAWNARRRWSADDPRELARDLAFRIGANLTKYRLGKDAMLRDDPKGLDEFRAFTRRLFDRSQLTRVATKGAIREGR